MNFSERMGITHPQLTQLNSMNEALENDIYNFFEQASTLLEDEETDFEDPQSMMLYFLWSDFFHNRVNVLDDDFETDMRKVERAYNQLEWNEKYDFLEFILNRFFDKPEYLKQINLILETNNSAFRFIKNKLIPITDKVQQKSIEQAASSGIDEGHIDLAIKELNNRKNSNYITVCKESIDAVETATKYVAKTLFDAPEKNALGKNINLLADKGFIENHPAYLEAISKIYGYASDGSIRHPRERDHKIDKSEAIFMLEMCSAFVSLLNSKLSVWQDK